MNRCLALFLALMLASITISSACVAQASDWIRFTLEPQRGDGIHASFRNQGDGREENDWSTGFRPSELVGLDTAGFRGAGNRPLRFAIVREAGRLDCAGNGGSSYASGNCRFTADPGFTQALVSRGIARPSRDQAFGLMAINAHRAVVDAIAAAHYPTPSVDHLMALSALGVTGQYINDMARAGYRPQSIDSLIQFKALNITPDWIGGLARIGYANLPSDDLVQLKALNITPDFITGFERIGYRRLPVDTLVQLEAVGVTPEFVRSVVAADAPMPPVDELVEMKVLGRRRR